MHRNKGRKFTKEHREKLRLAKIGKKLPPFTEEHKRKISESNKGKKLTKKQINKMSKALKGRKAWNKGLKCFWQGNKHWNWNRIKNLMFFKNNREHKSYELKYTNHAWEKTQFKKGNIPHNKSL